MSHLTNPNQRIMQRVAWFFIVLMINQIGFPVVALALTSGPTQPEVQSFQPVGTTDMVNLFSGDFNYNVPLFEVPGPDGGYPINLFYNSVTDANTEASWTGLGWNVNIGSLTRSMRGLPDDLNGEKVKRKQDMLKNETVQAGLSVGVELVGLEMARFGLSLGTSYIYNSYKGAGFTIEPGTSASFGAKGDGKFNPGINLGLSLSSIDAASFNTGFSLGQEKDNSSQGFNFGLSFNGREGLSSMTLGYTASINDSGFKKGKDGDAGTGKLMSSGGVSAGYSFTRTAYTPEVKIPWTGFNISGRFSFTPGGLVVYSKMGVSGSYSMQKVVNGGEWVSSEAYGYNYLQNSGDASLMDFNREKDGGVHRHNRFLATPNMTYDIYNVSGQGVGGMYRAHRNDFGFLHDQTLFSSTGGVSVGVEAGVVSEFGFDLNINYSDEANNRWPSAGDITNNNLNFKGVENNFSKNKEHLYYKAAGEMASEPLDAYSYLGGTAPLRLKREGFSYDKNNGGELESRNGSTSSPYYTTDIEFDNASHPKERVSRRDRNMSIQPLTNRELLTGSSEILPAYDVKYYDGYTPGLNTYLAGSPSTNLARTDLLGNANDKNAGFTVLGQNGVRWYYALPVQNKVQKEATFSVDADFCRKRVEVLTDGNGDIDYKRPGTHDYIDEKEIPEYAHSYMLTSVVGSDYVDVDGIDGPSDGDVGYWMKTSYVKLSDDYKWRAPFFGANFMEGLNNKQEDDMGSFLYGEREVYLPASIETKTHVAYFEISPREDARGASGYIQNEGAPLGESSYKLDKIKLYSKKELASAASPEDAVPIKTVHFEYDYSLCPNVENNPNTALGESGKLTLKKVWFTHENNTRGSLSPYVFDYTENPLIQSTSGTVTEYDYNEYKMDRWGVYKPVDDGNTNNGECENLNHPYVNQSPNNKANLDEEIMAWHLSKITMPSGAAMNIELERDDYAYVQNAVATQMVPIVKVGHDGVTDPEMLDHTPDVGQDGRRIYFALETPISANSPTKEIDLKRYLIDLPLVERDGDNYKQLYYKNYMNLRHNNNPTWEFVSGYAEIEQDNDGNDLISFDASSIDGNNNYTQAYIVLRNSRIEADHKHYHPMLMTAWRFLKGNLPDKMFNTTISSDPKNAIPKLAGLGAGIDAIFKNYYTYAYQKNFGLHIDLENSFIKLNTPDKIKYGGGARVKQITMEDNWDPTVDERNTKGVVYEYTTTDIDGKTISSGVMENETSVGYDECALRYADITEEKVDGIVKNVHVYEYPLNEGMYPGGGLGYSEVKVRSLASNYAYEYANNIAPLPSDLPVGFGTTGQVVHEFYTAKDFPVITSKTGLDDTETNPWLSMISSFLLFSRRDLYTGTQGYSIELNNMHGQTKGSKSYAQDRLGGMIEDPITQSEVNYKYVERVIEDRGYTKTVKVLDNEVEVLMDDNPNGQNLTPNGLTDDAYTTTRLVGVDYDFCMDSRESKSTSVTAGVSVNVDFAAVYPLPFPWPSFSYNENQTRLAVTNKVIQRRGIQIESHAYDGQSHVITTNKVFDRYTGQPVLTTVNNQLGGTIYNYTVPAYLAHSSMGLATENQGLQFEGGLAEIGAGVCAAYADYHVLTLNSNSQNIIVDEDLIPGDEYIISGPNNKTTGVYMGMLDDGTGTLVPMFDLKTTGIITSVSNLGLDLRFLNVRSGNRNLLSAAIAQYTTVETDPVDDANPMKNRVVSPVCSPDFVEFTEKTTVYGDTENYLKLLNEIFAVPNMTSYYGAVSNINFYQVSSGSLMYDYFDLFYGPYTGSSSPRWCIQEHDGFANLRIDNFGTNGQNQCYWPIETVNQDIFMSTTSTTPLLNASEVLDFFNHVIEIDIPSAAMTANKVSYNVHLNTSYIPPSNIVSLVTNHPNLNVKVIELEQSLICAPASTTRVEVELAQATGNDVKSKTINNVLSASASSFSDEWNTANYEYCQTAQNPPPANPNATVSTVEDNPYLTGEKGVWRAKSTYAYIDKRKFENKGNDVDIKTSGVVDDVALFNWENPFFEYCKNNWIRTEDVTKYNNMGAAVEARDIIGNYQAELYAYNDNVVVAKGVNTRYYEMGYEGFEEPGQEGSLQHIVDQGFSNIGNLDFLPSSSSCPNRIVSRKEGYRLCYPMKEPINNKAYILVRKPFDPDANIPRYINLTLENEYGAKHDVAIEETGSGEISQYPVSTAGVTFQIPGLAVPLNDVTAENFTVYKLELPSTCIGNLNPNGATDWWAGNASLVYEQNLGAAIGILPTNNAAEFSGKKAHTGKYSLKLNHGTVAGGKLTFPQNTLRMQTGKDYVFSAWVNYAKPANLESFTYDEITVKMCGTNIKPSGPIIDGWQKIEGTFTYDGDNNLDIINSHIALLIGYLDDARIFPAKANMQSYVYDPVNYRLKATLDNNNYATFYIYDEAGSLVLVNRETEKGIKSIQESRDYIKSEQ
jgi:hypothetical protein